MPDNYGYNQAFANLGNFLSQIVLAKKQKEMEEQENTNQANLLQNWLKASRVSVPATYGQPTPLGVTNQGYADSGIGKSSYQGKPMNVVPIGSDISIPINPNFESGGLLTMRNPRITGGERPMLTPPTMQNVPIEQNPFTAQVMSSKNGLNELMSLLQYNKMNQPTEDIQFVNGQPIKVTQQGGRASWQKAGDVIPTQTQPNLIGTYMRAAGGDATAAGALQKYNEDLASRRQSSLGRAYSEMMQIEKTNPNDRRLGVYQNYISKVANPQQTERYGFQMTAQGLVPVNIRTGEIGEPTGLGKPLSGEMISQESQLATIKNSLDAVKTLYKPDYVGAIDGRASWFGENLFGLDTMQSAFYTDLADIQNSLIYLKSGKQINESEYARLLKQLPERNLPDNVFQSRLTEFEKVLNTILESRESNKGGYGNKVTPTTPKKESKTIWDD